MFSLSVLLLVDFGINELLFSHSVVFNSLRPHGSQHTRLPCPSQTPRVCSINVYYIKLCRVGHDLATEQQQHKKTIGSRPLRHESNLSGTVSSVLLGYCTRSSSETFWAFILFFKEGRFGWLISPRVIHLYRFLHLFGGHFFFLIKCVPYIFKFPKSSTYTRTCLLGTEFSMFL